MALRRRVLGLYRDILRRSRSWKNGSDVKEAQYIREEARRLFEANRDLVGDSVIMEKVNECESRVELAEHYGNPYPRMYYAQPGTIYKSGNRGKSKVQPVYMHSYYDGGDFGIDSNQGAESLSDGSPADS